MQNIRPRSTRVKALDFTGRPPGLADEVHRLMCLCGHNQHRIDILERQLAELRTQIEAVSLRTGAMGRCAWRRGRLTSSSRSASGCWRCRREEGNLHQGTK